jgi:glycosyltransferase involved in cell wall biosynthesis
VEKNLDMLVRLAKRRPALRFVLIGDGPYKSALQQQLPAAVFPGFLTGDRLSREYASADIFLFPSETDTFGNVVLEAMSSGLPALVSDRMGPAEIVRHGDTGLIASSEEQFLAHLDRLAGNPGERQAMGLRARKYAESRDWNSILQQLFLQYESVTQVDQRRADLQLATRIHIADKSREALRNVSSSESS